MRPIDNSCLSAKTQVIDALSLPICDCGCGGDRQATISMGFSKLYD